MYWREPASYPTLKRNTNLTYTRKWRYRGLQVLHERGPLITQYLDDILETMNKALDEFPEIVVYRFELRFPHWIDTNDIGELSPDLITKFWASLVSQLKACVERLNRNGCNTPFSKLRNIWCKELPRMDWAQHYHCALVIDSSLFDLLCQVLQEGVFELLVKEAWARVIKVPVYEAPQAVWIPENNIYYVSKGDPNSYVDAFHRLSYLAKSSTKNYDDGSQWFGSTRS